MQLPASVVIKEVGPRDGLQNEKKIIDTSHKVHWINLLSDTGLSYIEVTSFVHPKWIPALADASDVFQAITRKEGVTYAALVPNRNGLERALQANADEISIFLSASDTHNVRNTNKPVSEALIEVQRVTAVSIAAGKKVRGYVSTVFGCPYEGEVDVHKVRALCEELFDYGVYEISLGDTIGVADPLQVEQVLETLLRSFPASRFAMHLHNTYGMALANVLKSLELGITVFDSTCGGLGGCPYAPGASGNVATNDLVYMLHRMGVKTNVDERKLHDVSRYIQSKLDTVLPSHVYRAQQHKSVSR